MSNVEQDGRSVSIDYEALGEARVKTILATNAEGWRPHQIEKAVEWLEGLRIKREEEAARAASESLRVANESLNVANNSLTVATDSLTVGKKSLRVMWLSVILALAALFAIYLTWNPNS